MAVPQTVPIHRLSFEDVLAMVEAEILKETDRVELENGVLVEMEPSGGSHANRVEWLTGHFVRGLDETWAVRVQSTFLIADGGFYEPDVLVSRPTGDELPHTAELVIEVAYSSRRRDDEKAATYAAAGVREYWIVDVPRGEVITHADLDADGYATRRRYGRGEAVTAPVPAPPVEVTALLGG